MAKNIRGSLKNLFEYFFLNIAVNVDLFSGLKFECNCENYPEILPQVNLKLETKIDRRSHEIFPLKITGS